MTWVQMDPYLIDKERILDKESILEYFHTQTLVMDNWQQILLYEDKH